MGSILYQHWKNAIVAEIKGTRGGTTREFNGKRVCYAYTHGHARAVKAMTAGKTKDYRLISDEVVDYLIDNGDIILDESECDEEGWLGCKVMDGDGALIGYVGARCNHIAGHGTDHVGEGRCKMHGGAKITTRVLAKMTNGRTAGATKKRLHDKVDAYMNDPDPLNLTKELATQRAFLDEFMDLVTSMGTPELLRAEIPGILKAVDLIGKMVDRIVSIEQRYALTAGQVYYIQLAVVETINKFIDNPVDREKATAFLSNRLGTDAALSRRNDTLSVMPTVDA